MKSYIHNTFPITYDGNDADRHEIDLSELSKSLEGLSKILSITANFVITGHYTTVSSAHQVKVFASEPKAKCYQFLVDVQALAQHPLFSGFGGALIMLIVNYAISKHSGRSEEMKMLKAALSEAIQELGKRDEETISKLLSTIDKMTDNFAAPLRNTVAPVGNSCETLEIGEKGRHTIPINAEMKAAILEEIEEITSEQTYYAVITELDLENQTCKLRFCNENGEIAKDSNRVKGQITDPTIMTSENHYIVSMVSAKPIQIKAKAALKNGQIQKLFISDATT